MDQRRHIAAHRGRRVAEAGGAHLSRSEIERALAFAYEHPAAPCDGSLAGLSSFEIDRALEFAYESANPTPQELRAAYAAGRAAGAARRPFRAVEHSALYRHRQRWAAQRRRGHVGAPATCPRVPRPRGGGRPARRRAGASSRTSSCDPGSEGDSDSDPPPPRGAAHDVALAWLHGGARLLDAEQAGR